MAGVGTDAQTLAAQVSDTDTGTGADAGGLSLPVSSTDSNTSTNSFVTLTASFTATDTGAGTDPEVANTEKPVSTDTGSGSDVGLQRIFFIVNDAGHGGASPTTPSDGDVGSVSDTAAVTAQVAFDTGSGADNGSRTISNSTFLADTDTGVSYDGNVDPLSVGPLYFWWGAELSAVTVTPPAETDTADDEESLRPIAVTTTPDTASSSAEVGIVSTAASDQLIHDSDSFTSIEVAVPDTNGDILDTDSSSGTFESVGDATRFSADNKPLGVTATFTLTADMVGVLVPGTLTLLVNPTALVPNAVETEVVGILGAPQPEDADQAFGDDQENVGIADSDAVVGTDDQTFTITSADTGAGAEQTDPAPPTDRDSIVVDETVNLSKVFNDSDTGAIQDTETLSAITAFTSVDTGRGTEAFGNISITSADTGSGADTQGGRTFIESDQINVLETFLERVPDLFATDTGVGHSYGEVSLPLFEDDPGTLVFITDPTGILSLVRDTAGALTMNGDAPGTLTLTADPPGTLVLTPDGDRSD